MPLNISTQIKNDGVILNLQLDGSLDTVTAPQFDLHVARHMADNTTVVVLDMKGLEYISSAGIRSIFKLVKTVKARGGKVAAVNRQPQIVKVFDIVKALPDMKIFANDQEMDEYLSAIQEKIISGQTF